MVIIISLGVALLFGLINGVLSLRKSVDKFIEDNNYPDIIAYDEKNPTIRSPYAEFDLPFYQTKETLLDVDVYRRFLKNVESTFRASKEYKAYKDKHYCSS